MTSLSNTDSIFFTPKSRDIHENNHQQQQLEEQHHHHQQPQQLHHHQDQQEEAQDQLARFHYQDGRGKPNPHFYHYSQQQQQQRPKLVVSHGRGGHVHDGAGGDFADVAAGGNGVEREPPDKNFHTGQDDWDVQHPPTGLVPFTGEPRSKERKGKKKKKKSKNSSESRKSSATGHELLHPVVGDTSCVQSSLRPGRDLGADKHESSFQSDISQAGSFSSRPLAQDHLNPLDRRNGSSSLLRDNQVGAGSIVSEEHRIPLHSSFHPIDSYPLSEHRARESAVVRNGPQTGYDDQAVKGEQLLKKIPPYGESSSKQYNNNSLSDSRDENLSPQQQMSLSSSSFPRRPPQPTSSSQYHNELQNISPSPFQPHQQLFQHLTPGPHSNNNPSLADVRLVGSSYCPTYSENQFPQREFPTEQKSRVGGGDFNDSTEEDNVFLNPAPPADGLSHTHPGHHPGLPRHSSLKPGHKMTYLTDDDGDCSPRDPNSDTRRSNVHPGLFGLEDISSVLEPESEQPSQALGPNLETVSPSQPSSIRASGRDRSGHASNNTSVDTVRPRYSAKESHGHHQGEGIKPLDMVSPSQSIQQHQLSPGDNSNTSTMSSGRPLGYTRDRLQGVLQKLREGQGPQPPRSRSEGRPHSPRTPQDQQPRSRSEGGLRQGPRSEDPYYPDTSAQSDPFPQNRNDRPGHQSRAYTSHPQIPQVQARGYPGEPPWSGQGSMRQPKNTVDVSSERNPYVNLHRLPEHDTSRHRPAYPEAFFRDEKYVHSNEENPYRNIPQPPLGSFFNSDMRHPHPHHDEEENVRRPRALSEGSRLVSGDPRVYGDPYQREGINRGASYPDVSLPRPSKIPEKGYDPVTTISQPFRPWYPGQQGVPLQQHHPPPHSQPPLRQQAGFEPRSREPRWEGRALDLRHSIPSRYSNSHSQPPPQLGYQSSSSSGIGSRNTSQSTGSLQHSHHTLPPHSSHLIGESGNNSKLEPRGRGGGGRSATSFSSGHTDDGDLSLDTSSGGYNLAGIRGDQYGRTQNNNRLPHPGNPSRHRRDTSVDENYEFDSINALENDIMDDLRRYSRLAGGGVGSGSGTQSLHGSHGPANLHSMQAVPQQRSSKDSRSYTAQPLHQQQPMKHPVHHGNNQHAHQHQQQQPLSTPTAMGRANAELRFERLREEFKAYRSQRGHSLPYGGTGSEDDSVDGLIHPPTADAALPIGVNGEPLYPMDSEML